MGAIAEDLKDLAKSPKKTLILDIETSPHLAYVWGLFNQDVGLHKLIESGTVISFAAKWLGDKDIFFFSDYHDGHDSMVEAAFNLVNEADIIIHYNGRAFDMKHLNTAFLTGGFGVPAPYKEIDLLQVVRSRFKLASNKLDYVAQVLGVGSKTKHAGFEMWRDCMTGNDADKAAAWKMMKKYNKQDVNIIELVYLELYPWISNHPVTGIVMNPEVPTCFKCGSDNLREDGVESTGTYIYPRYQCETCGTWVKGTTNLGKITNTKGVK